MNHYGEFLKMEAFANVSSKLLPMFTEEVSRIRKDGDYSQEALEKARLTEIIAANTGMNIRFFVSQNIDQNAFFKIPNLDNNHPFFSQVGFQNWFGAEQGISMVDQGGPLEGTVDEKNYRVSGIFSKLEMNVVIGHNWMKSSHYTNEEIAECLLHEVGHAYDYLRLLGAVVRDSWLISNASKVAVGSQPPEVKTKILVRTKEQLGIDTLNYEDLLKTADVNRKDAVEMVLVTNSLIKGTTQSKTPLYDARTVEQSADAFVAYHGGGRALASALVKLNKDNHTVAARGPVAYIAVELLKTILTLFMFYGGPLTTIIWLMTLIPTNKIYDSPEARLETLKQQCVSMLRQVKDPEQKAQLQDEIEAIEFSMAELKDRRTFYEAIFDTITPIGRKRYSQEQHQQMIKSLLFNDLQSKALKWRKTQ